MSTGRHERVSAVVSAAGLAVLLFLAGAILSAFKLFPYKQIHNAALGARAAFAVADRSGDDRWTQVWHKSRYATRGVQIHDPNRSSGGYVLYTSAHAQNAYLVARDGRVVHEWHLPYDSIWDRSAAVAAAPANRHLYWRKARVLPNGDLLVIVVETGMTPWGLGLVRLNRDSRVIWKYLERVHHDFWICADSSIVTLTHSVRERPLEKMPDLPTPFLEDFVVILTPDGRERKRISIYEALSRSPFSTVLAQAARTIEADYLHTNAVEMVESDKAAAFPFAQAGQVLVSMRDVGFIGLIDTGSAVFTWGMTGPWRRQHDPDLLADGTILLFDNQGRMGMSGGRSRVVQFDPVTWRLVWEYAGNDSSRFYSEVRGSQQRLPDGNTLITDSDIGRIFEVNVEGDVVWEYVSPAVRGNDSTYVPAICWASCVAASKFDSDFLRTLQP